MICTHLRQLYQLCEKNGVRISSTDLVHLVCDQCGVQEVCPSMLMTEYDAKKERSPSVEDSTVILPKKGSQTP